MSQASIGHQWALPESQCFKLVEMPTCFIKESSTVLQNDRSRL